MIKRSALLACLVLQSACTPFFLDDSCGPTTRSTEARGEIRDGAALQAHAYGFVYEERGGPSLIGAHIMGLRNSIGAPLRGRVQRVWLVNAATGDTLRGFPIVPAPPFGDEVIGVSTTPGDDDTGPVRRVLRDGDGLLLLDTDITGRPRISVPLAEVRAGDWGRASCS